MAVCKSVITGQLISLLKECRELISAVIAGGPGDQNSVQLFQKLKAVNELLPGNPEESLKLFSSENVIIPELRDSVSAFYKLHKEFFLGMYLSNIFAMFFGPILFASSVGC